MKILTYKFIIAVFLFFIVMLHILEKSVSYLEVYDVNQIIIFFIQIPNVFKQIILYLLYVLFGVRFDELESILNYF